METIEHLDHDARLLALLAEARDAEGAHAAACEAEDAARDDVGEEAAWRAQDAAHRRLAAALTAMAQTPAVGWPGIAAKVARICHSVQASGPSVTTILDCERPLLDSLAADLARLVPEVAG